MSDEEIDEKEPESEFGKGLTYCLGMFLAHAERNRKTNTVLDEKDLAGMWFNGASDHLYEMEAPETLPEELQERLQKFRSLMLDRGHGSGLLSKRFTEEDVASSIQEAKDLLRAIDEHFGIPTIKGSWE